MTLAWSSSTYNEFATEAHRIEELILAALAIEPQTEVLFCGFENSRVAIDRALAIGAKVAVIETRPELLRAAQSLGIEAIRASATGIPIRAGRFQLAVAYHYLHEVDPTYHTQIIFEMGRVAKRIAIVEPGPPSDLLGSRIASLYARAKQRLGQYEHYQTLEYWRRLLLGIRSHINPVEIRYAHLPPLPFLHRTMEVILESIKIAGADEEDLRSLYGLAAASDTQLIPQPRYVLLAGMSAADIPDRPRFAELQKQAPKRRVRTTKPVSSISEQVPSRETQAPKTRSLNPFAWFESGQNEAQQEVERQAAHLPLPCRRTFRHPCDWFTARGITTNSSSIAIRTRYRITAIWVGRCKSRSDLSNVQCSADPCNRLYGMERRRTFRIRLALIDDEC